MNQMIIVLALVATACATSYKSATKAEYVGNGKYQIYVRANRYTHEPKKYFYQAAYEICAQKDKGFEVIDQKEAYAADGVIECKGPVDPELKAKYERNN